MRTEQKHVRGEEEKRHKTRNIWNAKAAFYDNHETIKFVISHLSKIYIFRSLTVSQMMSNQLWYLSLLISLLNALLRIKSSFHSYMYDISILYCCNPPRCFFFPFLTHSLDRIYRRRQFWRLYTSANLFACCTAEETACYPNNGSELSLDWLRHLIWMCLIYFLISHTKITSHAAQTEMSSHDGRHWGCEVRAESNHNLISAHLSRSEYQTQNE